MRRKLYREDSAAFYPEATAAMGQALDEACNALGILDNGGREVLAERIIELARSGVLDANGLRERILREARVAA
jgi:hypothetical protein